MVHPARSRWHPVAARRSRGGRLAWTHPSPGAGSPPAASAHRSGSAGPPARKRCRCFANATGVLETPGLSRNAALRKAAFSPDAGVVETLQAFRGLLQAFGQRCRRSAGERPTPGGGGVRDWTAPRPRRPTADASVWSSGGRTARTGIRSVPMTARSPASRCVTISTAGCGFCRIETPAREPERPTGLGDPSKIRTCDTRFRKPLLYPLSYGAKIPRAFFRPRTPPPVYGSAGGEGETEPLTRGGGRVARGGATRPRGGQVRPPLLSGRSRCPGNPSRALRVNLDGVV